MAAYIAGRIIQGVSILLTVLLALFLLMHATGDPVRLMLPLNASSEMVEDIRRQLGLTEPLPVQYVHFLWNALHGDFGQAWRYGRPAWDVVVERLPATLQLVTAAIFLTVVAGVPTGVACALKRGGLLDRWITGLTVFAQSVPSYWLGIMLIMFIGVRLRWLPVGGRGTFAHLIMPGLTLALFTSARLAKMTRSAMLEVLGKEFVRTAKAKGVSSHRVVLSHALRNALLPVVTIIGLDLASLFGGAVITETVFAWPGMGRLLVQAVYGREYSIVQAAVFVIASITVLINLTVDLLYVRLDPRIRLE